MLGAAYTLWLVKRVIFGPVANDHVAELQDLNGREFLVLGLLAVIVVLVGVWPAPLLEIMEAPFSIWSSRSAPPSCPYDHAIAVADSTWTSLTGTAGDLPDGGDLPAADGRRVLAEKRPAPLGRAHAHPADARGWRSLVTAFTPMSTAHPAVRRQYVADPLAVLLKLFGFLSMAVALLYSREYLERRGMMRGEYYVLALTALLGIFVLVSANSLLTVYIGVELLSLSLYAMVAFDRDSGIARRVGDEVLRAGRHRIGHCCCTACR